MASHEGIELDGEEFVLYGNVAPDSLDAVFRPDAGANVSVQFDVDDVTVTIWGGGIVVQVTDREGNPDGRRARDAGDPRVLLTAPAYVDAVGRVVEGTVSGNAPAPPGSGGRHLRSPATGRQEHP